MSTTFSEKIYSEVVMNKTNAINFLNQYDTLQRSCKIIDEQMFDIMPILRDLKREENDGGALKDNVSRRVNKYLSELDERYKELSLRKRMLTYRIKLIESVVNSLPKNERKVIERFFLDPNKHYAAEDLMEDLEFEKTQIYRIRTRALGMISIIIENIPLWEESYEDT